MLTPEQIEDSKLGIILEPEFLSVYKMYDKEEEYLIGYFYPGEEYEVEISEFSFKIRDLEDLRRLLYMVGYRED